jgi:hypothetical protein
MRRTHNGVRSCFATIITAHRYTHVSIAKLTAGASTHPGARLERQASEDESEAKA